MQRHRRVMLPQITKHYYIVYLYTLVHINTAKLTESQLLSGLRLQTEYYEVKWDVVNELTNARAFKDG